MAKSSKFAKNDAGFTGLEAAIVLIAFVVVAAVFSYVMLGAGFFTSEKSKQTVHTGVAMATSSVQACGDIIGTASDNSNVKSVTLTLQLTAGQSAVDLSKTVVSFQDANTYEAKAWDGSTAAADSDTAAIKWINSITPANKLLEPGEMVQLIVTLPSGVVANDYITLTVIPPEGATLPISVTIPAAIHSQMALF